MTVRLRPAALVAWREIMDRARSRAFIVSTGLILLAIVGGVAATRFANFGPSPHDIGVAGGSATLPASIQRTADGLGISVAIHRYADAAAGEAALAAGTIDVLFEDGQQAVFEHSTDATLVGLLDSAAQVDSLPARLAAVGLTAETAQPLLQAPPLATRVIAPPAHQANTDAQPFALITVVSLLSFVTLYGGWILNGVVEEKSNRVVEVLLGTLRPSELLVGKVAGTLALALGQVLIGVIVAVVAFRTVGIDVHLPTAAPLLVGVALTSLVLGLLLYSFVYAAAGSTVSRAGDASSATLPVVVLLMVGYVLSFSVVMSSPDGLAARIASYIPFTAPLTMPTRAAIGQPAPWELALSAGLMLPAIAGTIWLTARLYSAAILHDGPRIGLGEAWRLVSRRR